MLGAGFSYLVDQAKAFIQRQAVIYGLLAVGGLILIFAAGYALDAFRVFLSLRIGGVYASLIVAGGLLFAALGCIGTALYIARSPSPDVKPVTRDPRRSVRSASPPRRTFVTSSGMLAGGAVTGLIAGILAAKRPWRRMERADAGSEFERVYRAPAR